MSTHKFELPGGWYILVEKGTADTPGNFQLERGVGNFFMGTMVTDVGPKGAFSKPMIFEKGDPLKKKIGDVTIFLRKSPKGRWMVQCEEESFFKNPKESEKMTRTARSSIDNPDQAVERKVIKVGEGYSNPARIGSPYPIFQHFAILGWSPQLKESMVDVHDYVQCMDMMGQSTFLKALQKMPDEDISLEIFLQIRKKN